MLKIAFINGVLTIAYMTAWFLLAKTRKRLDTVDIAWGPAFIVIALSTALLHPSGASLVSALLVTIWGTRLAFHIWSRARKRGEDPRYEELTRKWRGNYWLRAYFSIFLLQGALVYIIALPLLFNASYSVCQPNHFITAGITLWAIGFIIETIADAQLYAYMQLAHKPAVLETGLWRFSRHPNYFGELVEWWAIGVIALPAHFGWIGLIGPIVLTILIVFISGIPPIEKRRAKDAAYRVYQQKTSRLVPLPRRSVDKR